ncbi:hypothetical protein Tco_0627777 [Tanacetum coccineum]|uniref:Uncharacterized protein n=1 Tax=Tanacetum coccineum TaxID=301880 RepID=A0ABQ4WNG9_9ASTR
MNVYCTKDPDAVTNVTVAYVFLQRQTDDLTIILDGFDMASLYTPALLAEIMKDDYSTDKNSKEDTSDNLKCKRKAKKQRRLQRGTNDVRRRRKAGVVCDASVEHYIHPGSIAVTQAMANEFSSRKDAMLQKLLNDKAISDEESNNLQEQQRSSKCDWLDGSVHELSTDDSSMTSQRETLLAEISEEDSPDDVIRKLKGELVILSRQAKVSDMELQTLHKQIVKESKKGQDLSKEVQNTQESNAKLILAIQDVDEMLEHKHKWNRLLSSLDYEILKQGNHDMSYKLEQSENQEQLKMQYECSTSYATVNELEAHIEHLDNELKTKSKELSKSVLTIKELETICQESQRRFG